MDVAAALLELYGRIPTEAHAAIDGLELETLTTPPAPSANTIAWLIWHTARVQDHHVAALCATEQVFTTGSFAASFGLAPDPSNTGYGHTIIEAHAITPARPEALDGYLDAVHARTVAYLGQLRADDLDEVVDRRFDPPVTRCVRLVSIAVDGLQHVGQAAYARGILTA